MRKAFTFIEMLIYMGLVSVFFIVLSGMFGAILDLQLESRASSAVDQDAQYLLARINYDMRRASRLLTPASPGEISQSLSLNIGGSTYTYAVVGQKLQLTVSGVSHVLNSFDTQTTDFTVTRIGYDSSTPSARISLGLESVTVSLTQQPQTRSYLTTVSLR
jgi:hypothetical protein